MRGDFRLMIPSVLLAIILWASVIARGQATVWMDVPVQFEDIPAGLVIKDASTISVRVSVSGHERFVTDLDPSDIEVKASVSDIKKGEHAHVVKREDITVPRALKVTGLSPSVLHIQVEQTRKKNLPVRAEVTGLPAEGYSVVDVIVEPESVTVEGTREELADTKLISTKPVDISGAVGSVEVMTELDAKKGVAASHKAVSVKVLIQKERK